jgi:hypothetical protein
MRLMPWVYPLGSTLSPTLCASPSPRYTTCMTSSHHTHTVDLQINEGPWETVPTSPDELTVTCAELVEAGNDVHIRHLLPVGTPKNCRRCCAE